MLSPDYEETSEAVHDRVNVLAEAVDQELEADRRFFERRHGRSYRVRRSFRAEAETTLLLLDDEWPLKAGALFTVVRQLAPGIRARLFFIARRDLDTDISDVEAAKLFNTLNRSSVPGDLARAVAAMRARRLQ